MNSKKITISIIAVMLIAIVIAGGTYAFWYWQSDAGNQTAVNFVISRPGFTITGNNVSSSSLVPTTNCAHSTYAMMGNATVSANNNTSATMRATITLKGRLTPQTGRTLSNADKGHIHWAIKEVESASVSTYATANCSVAENSASFAKGTFSSVGSIYTDIATTITFDVNPNSSQTKYYQVYAWIDSTYEYTNTGSAITDSMQGLTINLTFSETSSFTQDIPVAQNSNEFTLADVPEEDGPYIYTISYTEVDINDPVPSEDYEYYTTRAEVIEAAVDWGEDADSPYYLRQKVEGGNITESYVEFIITSEFKARMIEENCEDNKQYYTDEEYNECISNYNAMTPGIYHIKGGDLTAYSNNISILNTAFGSGLCYADNDNYYDCQGGTFGMNIYATSDGYIFGVVGRIKCSVLSGIGTSFCWEE